MDNGPGKLRKQSIEMSGCSMAGEEVIVGPLDVLLGRGKSNETHLGNIKFRNLVRSNQERYFQTLSAEEKRCITLEIVDEIQTTGRFLKRGDRCWIEASCGEARQKVAHAIQYLQRKKNNGSDSEHGILSVVTHPESEIKSEKRKKNEQQKLLYSSRQQQNMLSSAKSSHRSASKKITNISQSNSGTSDVHEAFQIHSKEVHAPSKSGSIASCRPKMNPRQNAASATRRRRIGKSDPNTRDESDVLSVSSFFLSNPAFVEASARNFIASCGKPPPLSPSCRFQEQIKSPPEGAPPDPSGLSSLDASGIYSLSDEEIRGLDGQESLASLFVNSESDPWNANCETPRKDGSC